MGVKLSLAFTDQIFLATISKVFELDGGNFQYVFNLAAITKYSQPEEVINGRNSADCNRCAHKKISFLSFALS